MRSHLASVLIADRVVEQRRVPRPVPGAGAVLARVLATGICGSDLATYRGTHPYKRAPVVPGHEVCAEVVAVGEDVQTVAPGDLVCSLAYAPCGACPACARGATNLCPHRRNLGHGAWDGSFAEHVVLEASAVARLDPTVDPEAGALAEPLSIALHAVRLATPAPELLVLGTGGIGLCCTLVATKLDFGAVTCVDLGPEKEPLARAAGATRYVDARENGIAAVLDVLPAGADVTVVASAHPGALDQARAVTSPGGEVVVVGYASDPYEVGLNALVAAELTVRFSALSTPQDLRDVADGLAHGTLDPRPLVTHRYLLDEAADALHLLDSPVGGVGKILLHRGRT